MPPLSLGNYIFLPGHPRMLEWGQRADLERAWGKRVENVFGGVGPAFELHDLAPAGGSCSIPQAWIPLGGFPAAWAQGDRLSTAAAPLSSGRAVSVSPSSLNLEVLLAADASLTFPGGLRGKQPLG